MFILIVDDETAVRKSLKELLSDQHDVVLAEDGKNALAQLEKNSFDLVITDHMMPSLTGLELIRKGKEVSPQTAFILMTAYGTVQQAVEAIQLGADDYLLKPFDLSEIEHRVKKIDDLRAWKVESTIKQENNRGLSRIIGVSKPIQDARAFVEQVAGVISPILILGQSGVGKEVIAKSIHESGPRCSKPFIAINCASLSEQLMESELFGHEKGAFTGATATKPGKFELAKGGSLFLDEIGELSPTIQAKLLRVIQEKEFYRVGGIRKMTTDARLITATHRSLKEMVKSGTFREDLFFRLNVVSFEMSPLSERIDDIPLLFDFFTKKLMTELDKKVQFSNEVREKLMSYAYPGNVRELQNILERLIVLCPKDGMVPSRLLPSEFFDSGKNTLFKSDEQPQIERGLPDLVDELETRMIKKAMEQTGNNQVKAAELLKITRGALQYKLRKMSGEMPSDKEAA